MFQLQKVKFPSHKWKSLANGLRVGSLVPSIEANNVKDTVGMLQELISRWVGSTTSNQWVMLIDAVVMCDEPAVAQELATAISSPLSHSGTTTDIVSNQIKLLCKLLVCGLYVPFGIKSLQNINVFIHTFCVGSNGAEYPVL